VSTTKTKRRSVAASRDYIAYHNATDCYVNLAGTYDYLERPYYISQGLEQAGKNIRPTCKEMLDAYVPPIFLEKARSYGLPVSPYYITNGYFEPPVIIDPINPFMIKSRVILRQKYSDSIARSMTRNFTYAICCQELPERCHVVYFRSVLGWCVTPRFREASMTIWEAFHVPLARVRMIIRPDGGMLFSDISKLPFESLGKKEHAFLEEAIQWPE